MIAATGKKSSDSGKACHAGTSTSSSSKPLAWEAMSMYLTEATARRTLRHMPELAPGSHLAFTFPRKALVDGFAMYHARAGYDEFVTQQLWHFGPHPEQVAEFLAGYGWDLHLHAGAAEYLQR